jgi:anti-sigma-K factor RskA
MSEHERWADSVGAYLLGALPADELEGFHAHLAECQTCQRDVEHLQIAVDTLPIAVPRVSPPPALKARIMAVVESEAELLAAAGRRADRPQSAAADVEAAAPARSERRRRAFGGGSLGGWLLRPGVAAACALVLLVLGGLGGALLAGGGEGSRTVVAMTTAPKADVRLQVRDDGSTLLARNMPAPPAGRVYQVWLKRPGKDPQPTAVLWSPRRDGSAEVAVPGSLNGVEAVLVTDEPAGGSPAPTKPPVIAASPA